MPKFILSALPGLLVGLILGFGVAQLGQDEDEDAAPDRDRKLAKLCMAEAKKVLASSERPTRERLGPVRSEPSQGATGEVDTAKRAERAVENVLKRARAEKRWTVAHGKTAERMFPRLDAEAAAELAKKILTAVESGDLAAEADAWLPEKK
jgi:hypothetical protein